VSEVVGGVEEEKSRRACFSHSTWSSFLLFCVKWRGSDHPPRLLC